MTTPETVARTRVLVTIAELEARVQALERLADAATAYHQAFIVGDRLPRSDRDIEADFIRGCLTRLAEVRNGSA